MNFNCIQTGDIGLTEPTEPRKYRPPFPHFVYIEFSSSEKYHDNTVWNQFQIELLGPAMRNSAGKIWKYALTAYEEFTNEFVVLILPRQGQFYIHVIDGAM